MTRSYLRVGHKGAAALAPENTLASLGVALDHDVDMVEFDVVDAADGRLVLGHSREEISDEAPTLAEALSFLAAEAPERLAVDVDLKSHGFEREVVTALEAHGLLSRALVCSFFPHSLRELRRLRPELRTGLSYPWDRRGLSERRLLQPLVPAGAAALRLALPARIAGMVRRAHATSAMLHFSVVSSATVMRCHRLGISVFAWTVDEPVVLADVLGCGVDGVISNDPRIFSADGERRYDPWS